MQMHTAGKAKIGKPCAQLHVKPCIDPQPIGIIRFGPIASGTFGILLRAGLL